MKYCYLLLIGLVACNSSELSFDSESNDETNSPVNEREDLGPEPYRWNPCETIYLKKSTDTKVYTFPVPIECRFDLLDQEDPMEEIVNPIEQLEFPMENQI